MQNGCSHHVDLSRCQIAMATCIYGLSKDSGLSKPQADAILYLGKDRLCAFKCGQEFRGASRRLD
jgi:hypothetical protein